MDQHPLDAMIRKAQEEALKTKQSLFVVQDGLQTYSICTIENYTKVYPIKAVINPDGLIAAKEY